MANITSNVFNAYNSVPFSSIGDTRYLNSKLRINRDILGSEKSIKQFNNYKNWGAFKLAVDVDPLTANDFKEDTYPTEIPLFNLVKQGNDSIMDISGGVVPFKNDNDNKNMSTGAQKLAIIDPQYRNPSHGVSDFTVADFISAQYPDMIIDGYNQTTFPDTNGQQATTATVKLVPKPGSRYIEKERGEREGVKSNGVRSLFNKYHAVPMENRAYAWRVSQNMPLVDSPKTRRVQKAMNSCTVKDLVEKSHAGLMGAAQYEYSDFMFCKYLGKIPNNHLITLRRFAIPVPDYIKPYGHPSSIAGHGNSIGGAQISTDVKSGGTPMGTMVTWFGTPGNNLNDILRYSFKMPFKQINSKWEDDKSPAGQSINRDSQGAIGGAFSLVSQSNVMKSLISTVAGPSMFNQHGGTTVSTPGPNYDPNKSYAGVDMIKSICIRDPDKGLEFEHSFKLQFDYELRSYDGINGKQAMLDLLGNILTTCYTSGDFWPGAYRHTAGSSYSIPSSSLECMKQHKTFSGYVKAFQRDFQRLKSKFVNFFKNPIQAILTLLDNLGGMLLGGEMQTAPPQAKQAVNSLLTDAMVGFWHVTVGNPCAPILSIGNLILDNCEVSHYGPLGLDDFPTGIRVVCSLKHGKPRDKRLIERMYNGGNDRIYMPLNDTIAATLNKARQYNQTTAENYGTTKYSKDRGRSGKGSKHTDSAGRAVSFDGTPQVDAAKDKLEMKQAEQKARQHSEEILASLTGAEAVYVNNWEDEDLRCQSIEDIIKTRNAQDNADDTLTMGRMIKAMFGMRDAYGLIISAGEVDEGAPAGEGRSTDQIIKDLEEGKSISGTGVSKATANPSAQTQSEVTAMAGINSVVGDIYSTSDSNWVQ